MSDHSHVSGIDASSINARRAQINQAKAQALGQIQAEQIEGEQESMVDRAEQGVTPLRLMNDAKTWSDRLRQRTKETKESQQNDEDLDIAQINAVVEAAEEYENQNPEMNKRALVSLKQHIYPEDSPEEVLRKVLTAYPDQYLADEALSFLVETSDSNTKLLRNLQRAKELLNERFGREVRAGRNINTEAREFSKQGLGSPGALRDLYRDITGNPRDTVSLFDELAENFSFDKMKTVIKFVLHSIGSDMKSKGPSIERGLLQSLFEEARSMQAILGVYRFFYQRMRLLAGLFRKEDLSIPKRLTFELLAKLFVKYIQERYPSADKIFAFSSILGISDEVAAQIIVYTQFRDAIRGVSPRLFKSNQHRQDLLMTLIEAISELDDLLEEEEEEEEEETPKGWTQTDTME